MKNLEKKQQVTIMLSPEVLAYFRKLSAETKVRYQSLINLYLMECVEREKRPSFFKDDPET